MMVEVKIEKISLNVIAKIEESQITFTSLKSTIEMLEKGVKCVKS